MAKIILYSTHCPQCTVLENKMKEKDIQYEEVNDIKTMKQKGFLSVPILDVDGIIMTYREAFNYVSSL